ncbi:MAG: hypothetical protein L0219_02325 [Phycisphaerales bacterium]|nr:hypothetical protein [Phycisphaerales bacterium]
MAIERRKIPPDLVVDNCLDVQGMVSGCIAVRRGGTLHLHGTCGKDLAVEHGGRANVHGTVAGSVLNQGGSVRIYGVVNKDVFTSAGVTHIDPRAVIGGAVL